MDEKELSQTNVIENYLTYDFSNIWLKTDEELVYGIIGTEHQRLQIKLISIEKNINNPKEYLVYGKCNVKENTCDFVGKITLRSVRELQVDNFGVDEEYKKAGIKSQALLTADYEFFENQDQQHSGYFSGVLQSLFYIDKKNVATYNDINLASDGYFNNAFVGKWQIYNGKSEKICNWGDYRVPHSNCDFDIGVGEFRVSEKYIMRGWFAVVFKNIIPPDKA